MGERFNYDEIPEEFIPEVEDLTGDLRDVAQVIGVGLTLKLAQAFRGTSVYFRNIDHIIRKRRNMCIREAYDQGARVNNLARDFKLSKRQIETILSRSD